MPRYSATIEFDSTHNDATYAANHLIRNLNNGLRENKIISVVKISISPEEAVKQIQKLINDTAAYGNVSSDDIQNILNNVS